GANTERSRVRDHCQIHGRNRSAETSVGHVAGRAGLILKHGYVLVEIHELAEGSHCCISGALNGWRLTYELQRRQCVPLSNGFIFYEGDLAPNSCQLGAQVGRENASWVWVVSLRCGVDLIAFRNHHLREHR